MPTFASPLVIAHRGASGYEPENTLRAFELAIAQGAQMIELDLHLTADGHVVVTHDDALNERTDQKGRVSRMTLDQVRRADAGKGERIPTLAETLELARGYVELYLEIKDPRATAETIRLVRSFNMESDCLLASFDLALMRQLGKEIDDIALGLIIGSSSLNPFTRVRELFPQLAYRHFNYQILSVKVQLCSSRLPQALRRINKRLFVWTANDEATYRRLIEFGVDGIATDYPDKLISLLQHSPP